LERCCSFENTKQELKYQMLKFEDLLPKNPLSHTITFYRRQISFFFCTSRHCCQFEFSSTSTLDHPEFGHFVQLPFRLFLRGAKYVEMGLQSRGKLINYLLQHLCLLAELSRCVIAVTWCIKFSIKVTAQSFSNPSSPFSDNQFVITVDIMRDYSISAMISRNHDKNLSFFPCLSFHSHFSDFNLFWNLIIIATAFIHFGMEVFTVATSGNLILNDCKNKSYLTVNYVKIINCSKLLKYLKEFVSKLQTYRFD
jgi:hypothetical protein